MHYHKKEMQSEASFFFYQNHVYRNSHLNAYYQTITTSAFVLIAVHSSYWFPITPFTGWVSRKGPWRCLRHICRVNCAWVHLCVSTADEQMFMLMRRALGMWLALLKMRWDWHGFLSLPLTAPMCHLMPQTRACQHWMLRLCEWGTYKMNGCPQRSWFSPWTSHHSSWLILRAASLRKSQVALIQWHMRTGVDRAYITRRQFNRLLRAPLSHWSATPDLRVRHCICKTAFMKLLTNPTLANIVRKTFFAFDWEKRQVRFEPLLPTHTVIAITCRSKNLYMQV